MRFLLLPLLVFLLSSALIGQPAEPPDTLYRSNPRYWSRCDVWEADTSHATIVMLGNSITEGGDWATLLGRDDVANRGIGSDNLYGFLARMRYVTALKPRACFVMGGINDLYAGFTVETVVRNYASLIDSLRSQGIVPIVQSTLFASPRWRLAREKNQLVGQLNAHLQQLCRVRGIPYLDLNNQLITDGVLADEYTTDGIHLTAAAYQVWADAVRALLRLHGI